MMKPCLICVDAGGTKTEVVVFTLDKKEITSYVGGSANFAFDAKTGADHIFDAVDQVFEQVKGKYQPLLIQMGISGWGAFNDQDAFIERIERHFKVTTEVVDDARLALYSVLKDEREEGVLILAGTGSACFGVKGDQYLLVGGWGHLLGDEGSAHHLVLETFKRMIRDEDEGRLPRPFARKMLEHLGLNTTFDLKKYVYSRTKAEIAAHAQFVDTLAEQGDEDAITLLKKSGEHLARLVELMFNRLGLREDAIIGCQGSFLLQSKTVDEAFKNRVRSFNPKANFYDQPERPVLGAYYLAKRYLGKENR